MKKEHTKLLMLVATVSTVACFSAAAITTNRKVIHMNALVEQEVWNHYSMVAPTETEKGIKEYWVSCDSHTYSFVEPQSGTIYNKGTPSSEFINSLEAGDSRLYDPYGNYLYFYLSDNHYTVLLSNSNYSGDVYIPSTYEGYPVTEIGSFSYASKLQSIIIPEGVTTIDSSAFSGCSSLAVIILPSTLTSVGASAFQSCNFLTHVLFRGTQSQWNSVNIFNSQNDSLINATKHYTYTGTLKTINDGIYKYVMDNVQRVYGLNVGDTHLTSFVFGELFPLKTLISMADYCLSYNTYLTTAVLPSTVVAIGQYAFNYCTNLQSIIIPESVKYIGYNAFLRCDNLTIYCRAASKPAGWNNSWNSDNRPVVWGYTGN